MKPRLFKIVKKWGVRLTFQAPKSSYDIDLFAGNLELVDKDGDGVYDTIFHVGQDGTRRESSTPAAVIDALLAEGGRIEEIPWERTYGSPLEELCAKQKDRIADLEKEIEELNKQLRERR